MKANHQVELKFLRTHLTLIFCLGTRSKLSFIIIGYNLDILSL